MGREAPLPPGIETVVNIDSPAPAVTRELPSVVLERRSFLGAVLGVALAMQVPTAAATAAPVGNVIALPIPFTL